MKTHKPDDLSLLYSPFHLGAELHLSVGLLACFPLRTPGKLLPEAEMWKRIAPLLPRNQALDIGYPKPRSEFLVFGHCHPLPPAKVCDISVQVGPLAKTLRVSAPRVWNKSLPSLPEPFEKIPVDWEHAYGGPGYADNPQGIGHGGAHANPLPCITQPGDEPLSPDQVCKAVGFAPMEFTRPSRLKHLGSFDAAWIRDRWPHYPLDTDPEFFLTAPEDQRLPGFFTGNEGIRLVHMHPEQADLNAGLPKLRGRLFLQRREGGELSFHEAPTRPETLWLFPDADCGVLLYRGTLPIQEDDLYDVTALVAAWEPTDQPPQAAEAYRQRLAPKPAASQAAKPAPAPAAKEPPPAPAPAKSDAAKAAQAALEKQSAALLAQFDGLLAGLGLSREEAMARYLPPQPAPSPVPSKEEGDAMLKEFQGHVDSLLAKAGLSREEALARLQPEPEKLPVQEDLSGMFRSLYGQMQDIAAKLPPGKTFAEGMDPRKLLAEVNPEAFEKALAGLKPPKAAPPPGKAVPAAPPNMSAEQVVERYRRGESLAGLDLSKVDLSGQELTGADFSGATLAGTRLARASLGGAKFTKAILADADLSEAILEKAVFSQAQASGASFAGAKLSGADFSGAGLAGADLSSADLDGADLSRTDLSGAVLKAAVCRSIQAERASFRHADLSSTSFDQADLPFADFSETRLDKASFGQANLADASFEGSKGNGTVFSGAGMARSRGRSGTVFEDTLFDRADLSQACWEDAQFSRCRLDSALLDGGEFNRCLFAFVHGNAAKARKARFRRAGFKECSLQGVDFFQACLAKATLVDCDLKNAHFFSADLQQADFGQCELHDTDFRRTRIEAEPPNT